MYSKDECQIQSLPLTKLDSTYICSFMDPVCKTILALDDKSGPNPLLEILKSTLTLRMEIPIGCSLHMSEMPIS